jgi:DNA (cytosine-5)-methyltransferase 1
MIEYYIKYETKNLKTKIEKLIEELDSILNLENISLVSANDIIIPELLEKKIGSFKFYKLNNIYHTIYKYQKGYPFLKKYINKEQVKTKRNYSFIDLFAGCGGLSVGLENAGFNPIFVNEIDPTFAETYYFNHDLNLDQYYVGDINKLLNEFEKYSIYFSETDLVCGGPPCQGFSMANRQRLIDDPRNTLYKSYLNFLREVRPKFFIMENVKGMASKIEEILIDFNKYLGKDYNFDYALLNAKDFGVPQNRERFFLIGNRIGIDSKKIFKQIKKEKKVSFVLRDSIYDLPQLSPKTEKNNNDLNNEKYGFTISKAITEKTQFRSFINSKLEIDYILNHKNRYNNNRDIEIFGRLPQGANSLHDSIKDIMPYTNRNHIFKDKYFKLDEHKICKTITSHMKFDCNMYIHPSQARGLSPREAARIQTFPDDYFFRGTQNKWYAQIGNAVPVKLAEIIGKQIIKYL